MNAYVREKRGFVEVSALAQGSDGIIGRAVWRFAPDKPEYDALLRIARSGGVIPFADLRTLARQTKSRPRHASRAAH